MAMRYRQPEAPKWCLWFDCEITRRKLYQVVTDPEGTPVFRSRFVSECMAYLYNEGIEAYALIPNDHRTLGIELGSIEARSAETWQK